MTTFPIQRPAHSSQPQARPVHRGGSDHDRSRDSEPDREHRKGPKRVVLAGLLAAAAVVAIALVAIRNDDPASPADQPSPTVTVAPTVPPRALFGTPGGQFVPGTYYRRRGRRNHRHRGSSSLSALAGPTSATTGRSMDRISVSSPSADPTECSQTPATPSEGYHPGPVTTLDGLVAALSEQGGWANVTTPSDITVDGYAGKEFQRTAPAEFTDCDTGNARFPSWGNGAGRPWTGRTTNPPRSRPCGSSTSTARSSSSTRDSPDTRDPNAVAGLAAVLDSIRIEQA